jgi:transcriptional repressor NrdR
MKCNQCTVADTKVIESRDVHDGQSVRRRRECLDCTHRFTTYERVEQPQITVIKSDGNRELFDRHKLLAGLRRACEKTPVTSLQLERLVSDIEKQILSCGEQEIPSGQIGDMVIEKLSELNEVAYVRFASVYRKFTDISGFERELLQIRGQQNSKKQQADNVSTP